MQRCLKIHWPGPLLFPMIAFINSRFHSALSLFYFLKKIRDIIVQTQHFEYAYHQLLQALSNYSVHTALTY